jgi:hypothetical protein
MKRLARGVALVEQLVVGAAVGAASVTALPALQALQVQAQGATLANLAGAGGSAMALNYGGCLVTGQVATPGKCQPIRNCNQVASLWLTDLPPGYALADVALQDHTGRSHGAEAQCTITDLSTGVSAGFRGIAAGD